MLQLWRYEESHGGWQTLKLITLAETEEEARVKIIRHIEQRIAHDKPIYVQHDIDFSKDEAVYLARIEKVKTAQLEACGETLEEFHDG